MSGAPARVLVIHAGALGDAVLVWPLLRALARAGAAVTFAARPSHARLASRWIEHGRPGPPGITPADADTPELSRLWSAAAVPDALHYDHVLTFLADNSTPAGRLWFTAAAARWPGARIVPVGAPATLSRLDAWRRADVASLGSAPIRVNPDGPVILHVGAGGHAKRWPLDRFIALADALTQHTDAPIHLIAGEVEAERFTPNERDAFAAARGRILPDLDTLALELAPAALVVGNDSGPSHLAAQLGVPTLALFGPTDPLVWSPIGPFVRVLAPPAPAPIDALPVDAVLDAATDALALARFHRPASDRPIITRLA